MVRRNNLGGEKKELSFYKGKKVLITGHTGFKGSWLTSVLLHAGAEITGFALPPVGATNLWMLTSNEKEINSVYGDIRDLEHLLHIFKKNKPEIVFHMAAQPIVRKGYRDPVGTYCTNVMGTVNILECVRKSDSVKSFLNVTTDKVYKNKEWLWGYREIDPLGGSDPYANSKSCSELITDSYNKSFLFEKQVAVSTVRAGNVIGGGDFSEERIIPDCVRAAQSDKIVRIRNPHSIRPYQYVLEALSAYMLIAQRQYENLNFSDCYNVGPESSDCIDTETLVNLFCRIWGDGMRWEHIGIAGPHENSLLKLDCSKLCGVLGWRPRWGIVKAVEETVAWTKNWLKGHDVKNFMEQQIKMFFSPDSKEGILLW